MCIVTKATAIQFIDSKCHIKKRKCRKSAYPVITHVFSRDLILMLSGWTHTHTYRHANKNNFKKPGTYEQPSATCTWFKK